MRTLKFKQFTSISVGAYMIELEQGSMQYVI